MEPVGGLVTAVDLVPLLKFDVERRMCEEISKLISGLAREIET